MNRDEQAIRELHAAWGTASRGRDLDRILQLVTDDCVFLMPGSPPIEGKGALRAVYEQMFSRWRDADIVQDSRIDEIEIAGDWAFWRGTDSVTITPRDGASIRAAGHGMGILRRENGAWRFARGINNMMPAKA